MLSHIILRNGSENVNLYKKIFYLIIGAILSIVIYFACIGVYTHISSDPIIFFASITMAVLIPIAICLLFKVIIKIDLDGFTTILLGILYAMEIILVSVFGPTFIDRSISYHLAFYAVEEGNVYIDDIEYSFSKDIFDKRLHDAITTGFLSENSDGSLSPTFKSRVMYAIMKPLGELTGSMDTYYGMKDAVDMQKIEFVI